MRVSFGINATARPLTASGDMSPSLRGRESGGFSSRSGAISPPVENAAGEALHHMAVKRACGLDRALHDGAVTPASRRRATSLGGSPAGVSLGAPESNTALSMDAGSPGRREDGRHGRAKQTWVCRKNVAQSPFARAHVQSARPQLAYDR